MKLVQADRWFADVTSGKCGDREEDRISDPPTAPRLSEDSGVPNLARLPAGNWLRCVVLRFEQFPDGNDIWLIKAIDRCSLAWGRSRTCRVEVLLQRLAIDVPTPRSLARYSTLDVAQLLGTPFGDPVMNEAPRAFIRASLLIGCLPLLQIGQVYHQKTLVGRLPGSQEPLALPAGRSATVRVTAAVGAQTGTPAWRASAPLPRYQFRLPDHDSMDAGYSIYKCQEDEFLIPDSVILQAFYMPHRDMAIALSSGPWEQTASQVIAMDPLDNGLATQVHPESGEWHVVLRPTVPSSFARLLALLWFDPFARRCANSLFFQMHQALSTSNQGAGQVRAIEQVARPYRWRYQPDLPFRTDHPLDLQVEGYWLRGLNRQPALQRKFLVTRILGCSQPAYLPTIRFERANSSEPVGDEPESAQEEGPAIAATGAVVRGQTTQEVAGAATITAELDAEAFSAIHLADAGEFAWTGAPELQKLPKIRRIQPAPVVLAAEEPRQRISAGATGATGTAEGDALADLLVARVRVGTSPGRLRMVHAAVEELRSGGRLSRYQPIPPVDIRHRLTRGALDCWNFLSRDEAAGWARRPTRGWKVVQDAPRSAGELPLLRAALVVGIEWDEASGTWFEIECRPHEAYRSVLVLGSSDLPDDIIHDILQEIAVRKGRELHSSLAVHLFGLSYSVATYQHHFERRRQEGAQADEQAFDSESIWRFLRSAQQ